MKLKLLTLLPLSTLYSHIVKLTLPPLLGIISFWAAVGPKALYPINIAWLEHGDKATAYLGWLFFRTSDWSFPIGLNPAYGLELSSAIAFSDSNPLLAFFFKFFSSALPDPFQYFGIWLLICFVLQACFAWKLMGLLSDDIVTRIIGSSFFVFAPPMLFRIDGHLNLCGHFILLAAIYMNFRRDNSGTTLRWGLILVSSVMIHAYLLAMAGALWVADLVTRTLNRRTQLKRSIGEFILLFLCVAVAIWQTGYLTAAGDVSAGGYGFFRMNALSVLNPFGWSYILGDIPVAAGDYEGFNYLGLGLIILCIAAMTSLLKGHSNISLSLRKYFPLLVCLIALTLFSLSNRVGIGLLDFEYPLPSQLEELANVFRASGRMFWPVYYSIIFVAISIVMEWPSRILKLTVLSATLAVQLADTSAGWIKVRQSTMIKTSSDWDSQMINPFWRSSASEYEKLRYIPPDRLAPNWRSLAIYAGNSGMKTNTVNLARLGKSRIKAAKETSKLNLIDGIYSKDTLYILEEGWPLMLAYISIDQDKDLLAKIDDFNVLAPSYKLCADCYQVNDELTASDLMDKMGPGDSIDFASTGGGESYLMDGWSVAEPWGTWSLGRKAELVLRFSDQASQFTMLVQPLVTAKHPIQFVEARMNDIPVGSWTLTEHDDNLLTIKIPPSIAKNSTSKEGFVLLQLNLPFAISPLNIELNKDQRELAIGLKELYVE